MRRMNWEDKKQAIRDRSIVRAQTFKSKKSYKRKPKHGRNYE